MDRQFYSIGRILQFSSFKKHPSEDPLKRPVPVKEPLQKPHPIEDPSQKQEPVADPPQQPDPIADPPQKQQLKNDVTKEYLINYAKSYVNPKFVACN